MGVTITDAYEDHERRGKKRDRQVIEAFKVIGVLPSCVVGMKTHSVNVVNTCVDLEANIAKVYFLEEPKSSDKEVQEVGSICSHPKVKHHFWKDKRGNQGRNKLEFYETSQQELLAHLNMKRILEHVLEKVISTNVGVDELILELLALSKTVESHVLSIEHL